MLDDDVPEPGLTHGAALGGARTLTQQAAERRRKEELW